jgi:molecular chaperone DnaK
MNSSFGIDLGTTNSSISHLVDGRPVAIPVDGSPIVPSMVLYLPDRVVVGREARNLELSHPEQTVRSVKRQMGRDFTYTLQGKPHTPEEVSSEILKALRRGAEAATGEPVRDVVITVPAYFDDAQRRATLKAGELAGLNVLRLLNEPTSASLVYDQALAKEALSQPEIVLIYDLGGGTFDVSVLEVFEGVREVRATTGNTRLGGDDFDEMLVRHFLDHLKQKHQVDPRPDARAMARLKRVAESTKIALSRELEVAVSEEFLTQDEQGQPVHLKLSVTRAQLEAWLRPLLESTIALSLQALEDAHLTDQPLSRICLVGGSTRVPLCRELLAEAFATDIHEEIDPDLAVALGASIQAGLLSGVALERILVDVASHTLGIRVLGPDDSGLEEPDTFAPILAHNTVLPAERTREFYTLTDEQEHLLVEVFQGESRRVSGNTAVGEFMYPLEPAPTHSPVRVRFAYDLNGVIRVSVWQPGKTNEKTVALSLADAGKAAQQGHSALEKKARALLEELETEPRAKLERLLAAFLAAQGAARTQAEEALLDFFLDHDSDPDEDEDEG